MKKKTELLLKKNNEINNVNNNLISNSSQYNNIKKKVDFFKDIIEKTIFHINKNKLLGIINVVDVNICMNKLYDINLQIKQIVVDINSNKIGDIDQKIIELQNINNELSSMIKNYGTYNLIDLLVICFGNDINYNSNDPKFDLLKKYFHPISYKILNNINNIEHKGNLDCFDINNSYKQFYVKVHGIKLHIYSSSYKKGLLIYGILDEIVLDFLSNDFLTNKLENIKQHLPNDPEFKID